MFLNCLFRMGAAFIFVNPPFAMIKTCFTIEILL